MNLQNKLYPFGFIFSDSKLNKIPPSYDHVSVLHDYNFYYDKTVEPHILIDNDYFIIIHGHFVHTSNQNSISNNKLCLELLNMFINDYNQFLETLDFIGGRYVIIIGNLKEIEIYQDATGARSVYYMTTQNVVASHLHMIADNYYCPQNPIVNEVPTFKISFTTTEYNNVNSLIPNFKLSFFKKNIERFYPREENKYKLLSKLERIDLVNQLWKDQLQYYVHQYKNIILSLTGGNDSRVSLAMIKDFENSIEFFTYAPQNSSFDSSNRSHQILNTDRIIVEKILDDINLNHKFLYFNEDMDSKFITDKIENILHRNVAMTHNPFLLKHFINTYGGKNYLHIRANLLEIGRAYFITPKKHNNLNEVVKTFKHSIRSYINEKNETLINEYIDNTMDVIGYDGFLYNYHVLDLYYWEHRTGRWHAEVLNETDMAFQTMLPFNMRAIIELSLSFSIKERKSNYLFKELINKNYPILNFYGENNIKNLYEQTRDSIKVNHRVVNEKSILKSFYIYQNSINKTISIKSFNNSLYIPKKYLHKNNYAYKNFIFTKNRGFIKIDILNKYISANNKSSINYAIYKNDDLLINEDVSDWNYTNNIIIFNLKKNDRITLCINSLKDLPYKSWEDASKIEIKNFEEVQSDTNSDIPISHTSPHALTYFN